MVDDSESEELEAPPSKKMSMNKESQNSESRGGSSTTNRLTAGEIEIPTFVTVPEYIDQDADHNVEIINNEYVAETVPASNSEKDEFAFFSEFLSSQLRMLPKSMSVELMCKIHVQISEARMKAMAGKT